MVAPDNRDLVILKKRSTGSRRMEMHILSASSGYKDFVLHAATALHEVDETWAFVVAFNRDIVAIKTQGTGSRSTEVHVMSAASGYSSFSLQTRTSMHETDNSYTFLMTPNRDLAFIKTMGTGSRSTEVHILGASSGYKDWALHSATALHEVDGSYTFLMAPNKDVYIIKRAGTGSRSTEIHALSARANYQQWALQTGTALHETDSSWTFALAANLDLYAIKTRNTGSRSTELHVLSSASGYRSFVLNTGTGMHEV